jgi:hypothetical protein
LWLSVDDLFPRILVSPKELVEWGNSRYRNLAASSDGPEICQR